VTRAIVSKELRVQWLSPVPYVVGALFHLVLGVLVVDQLVARRQALIQPLFPIAGFLLLALVPVLCMRSFADEARTGTLDLLQAVPVRGAPLARGKWIAAWLSVLAVLAPAGLFVVVLALYGAPDTGPVVAGFCGLVLFAAGLAGIGVLASALSSSQPVAAVLAFFVSLLLWFAHRGTESLGTGGLLDRLSLSERLRSFAGGVVDSADVTFFVLLVAVTVVLAGAVADGRRLR
jgi:ABC-2 type transport system permease protein